MDCSISEYFYKPGGDKGHSCGYCGSKDDTKVRQGMRTHYLTCEDYQDLIDRGWRRSGTFCYKPVMDKTCCPQYTIRCVVTEFRISKSQKTVLKQMNDFLLHNKRRHGSSMEESGKAEVTGDSTGCGESEAKATQPTATLTSSSEDVTAKTTKKVTAGLGPDPSKPPCRKAKDLRRERKQQKLAMKVAAESKVTEAKQTDLFSHKHLATTAAQSAHPRENIQDTSTSDNSRASFLEVGLDGKKPVEMFLFPVASDKPPAHKLEMKLVSSSPPSPEFQATFKESYNLYKKYQMAVHHDKEEKCTEKRFHRFLCDSPLIPAKGARGWHCDYGSYHQQYYIDGKLIMVGVIDILPKCLSSVYVFYDPDYSFVTPGVYSALRELEMVRKMYLYNQTFQYYYMGYYVHSCQKMRYKGGYYPSHLLCPESYHYIPIESCKPKLDVSKFARLNDAPTDQGVVEQWLDNTMVVLEQQAMPYSIFRAIYGDKQDPKVRDYASLVGPRVASRMLLYLS